MRDILPFDDVRQVYELCRSRAAHRLPSIKVGKVLRFLESDLLEWLSAQRDPSNGRSST